MHWALSEYASHHGGSVEVNASFEVPNEASWPEALRGMQLGRAVAAARELESVARDAERRARKSFCERAHPSLPRLSKTRWGRRLSTIGFDWGDADRRYRLLAAALRAYNAERGDAVLPRNFRVPNRPPYPRELAGSNLDRAVYCLPFYREHVAGRPERQTELRELGFVWARLQPEFNLVIEALLAYRRVHGDMAVPVDFRVPLETDEFPVECRGMPLGRRCSQIRNRHDFVSSDAAKWEQLDSIGFVWSLDRRKRDKLGDAIALYRRRYGTEKIPLAFVVPSGCGGGGEEDWPEALHGFPLGRRAYDARRPASPQARSDRFRVILAALEAYVRLHGDADVPRSFVVPDDDRAWPRACAGVPLGERVAQIRYKDYYLKGPHGPERRAALANLGFVWRR